jgi:hypothetical protein
MLTTVFNSAELVGLWVFAYNYYTTSLDAKLIMTIGIQRYQNLVQNTRGVVFWLVIVAICFQFIFVAAFSASSTPSNIIYLLNGSVFIVILVVALQKIQNLISTYPEIRQSHNVMQVHMWLFLSEEVCILLETTGQILLGYDDHDSEEYSEQLASVVLNMCVATTNCLTNAYIAYLMIYFSSAEVKKGTSQLFRSLLRLLTRSSTQSTVSSFIISENSNNADLRRSEMTNDNEYGTEEVVERMHKIEVIFGQFLDPEMLREMKFKRSHSELSENFTEGVKSEAGRPKSEEVREESFSKILLSSAEEEGQIEDGKDGTIYKKSSKRIFSHSIDRLSSGSVNYEEV